MPSAGPPTSLQRAAPRRRRLALVYNAGRSAEGAIHARNAWNVRRHGVPAGAVSEVVTGSTPVVAFGDPRNASVATLGINPSWHEFLADDGSLLSGSKRRLATLTSLNAKDTALLDLDQARTVFEDCAAYFQPDRNPYRRWFDPLDQVLRAAFGVSYYAGTACHLDLVQWATTPVWSELSRSTKGVLVREGLPYLRRLLSLGSIRIVLLNGRQVIEQIKASRLFELEVCGNLAVNGTGRGQQP